MRPLGELDPRTAGPFRLLAELTEDETGRTMLASGDGLFLVKLVHAHVADEDGFRTRLRQDLAERGRGAGTVQGDADAPVPWVAVEYVPGASLQAYLDKPRSFSAYHLLWLATGLAKALKKLHGNGLVHGELTPVAVRLTGTGPVLIDFGTARATGNHTPADDMHALGVLLEKASERPLPGPVRRLVAACMAPAAKRPSAAALLKMIKGSIASCWHDDVHNLARAELDKATDLLAENAPEAVRWLQQARDSIDNWPGYPTPKYRQREKPTFVQKRARSQTERAEDAEQRTEEAEQQRVQRLGERVLVFVTAAFVGWATGQLVFGGAEVTELPRRATLASTDEDALFLVPFTWTTVGFTLGAMCAVLLVFIARPRTRRPVWVVLVTLSVLPYVFWTLNTRAGLDIDVVTVSSGHIVAVAELLAIILAAGTYGASNKLFPDMEIFTWLFTFLTGSVAFMSLAGCMAYGWMGVVVADVVRFDVATVVAAVITGSVAHRVLQRVG